MADRACLLVSLDLSAQQSMCVNPAVGSLIRASPDTIPVWEFILEIQAVTGVHCHSGPNPVVAAAANRLKSAGNIGETKFSWNYLKLVDSIN